MRFILRHSVETPEFYPVFLRVLDIVKKWSHVESVILFLRIEK